MIQNECDMEMHRTNKIAQRGSLFFDIKHKGQKIAFRQFFPFDDDNDNDDNDDGTRRRRPGRRRRRK